MLFRSPGPVAHGAFSPARSWRPAVVDRLARTLGRTKIAHRRFPPNFRMLVSKFHAQPIKRRNHQQGRLSRLPKEQVRGAIRGAAHRERLLHPSPAKSIQRRTRFRLLAAYVHRFGQDEFSTSLGQPRFEKFATLFWLPTGYAWWKERVFGKKLKRPFK